MGWFFGFKLHLVFNHRREIVALKLTPSNVSDTAPLSALTKGLSASCSATRAISAKNWRKNCSAGAWR
jgi:hypothetical protein